MSNIEFNILLRDEDWVQGVGGWRCEALLIPGANLEAVYYNGEKADIAKVCIESSFIRWLGGSKPQEVWIRISLTKDLPKLEEQKIRLEKEKLNLERQKVFVDNRWKIITALGAVASSVITLVTTNLVGVNELAQIAQTPPRIHTYTGLLSIPEDECVANTARKLKSYGAKNVTPVQRGIYATVDEYNVFVGCNEDIKAVSLVVSGPDDSVAKKVREEIRPLLP